MTASLAFPWPGEADAHRRLLEALFVCEFRSAASGVAVPCRRRHCPVSRAVWAGGRAINTAVKQLVGLPRAKAVAGQLQPCVTGVTSTVIKPLSMIGALSARLGDVTNSCGSTRNAHCFELTLFAGYHPRRKDCAFVAWKVTFRSCFIRVSKPCYWLKFWLQQYMFASVSVIAALLSIADKQLFSADCTRRGVGALPATCRFTRLSCNPEPGTDSNAACSVPVH